MTLVEETLPPGLYRLVRLLLRVKTVFVVVTLPILPLTFFGVVFFRYILEKDLFAYEEWLMAICFWNFFLASALGTFHGKQINADILDAITDNQRILWLRKLFITVIEVAISVVVLYWAYLMLADEIAQYPKWKTTIALKIPFFIPRLGIFVGFAFMTLYSALLFYVMWSAGPKRYAAALATVAGRQRSDEAA